MNPLPKSLNAPKAQYTDRSLCAIFNSNLPIKLSIGSMEFGRPSTTLVPKKLVFDEKSVSTRCFENLGTDVKAIALKGCTIPNWTALFQRISGLSWLVELSLTNCKLTDKELSTLVAVRQVTKLLLGI